MPATNQQRRKILALESMARSSARIARSVEQIERSQRESIGFWRWLLSAFEQRPRNATQTRHYGDSGGLTDYTFDHPVAPTSPGGIPALPDRRPCINVTPTKTPEKAKGWLW